MARLTRNHNDAYQQAAENWHLALEDANRMTVALVTRCDELNADMAPIYALAQQVFVLCRIFNCDFLFRRREIKSSLDALEAIVK
jgi:hypothetical protein